MIIVNHNSFRRRLHQNVNHNVIIQIRNNIFHLASRLGTSSTNRGGQNLNKNCILISHRTHCRSILPLTRDAGVRKLI